MYLVEADPLSPSLLPLDDRDWFEDNSPTKRSVISQGIGADSVRSAVYVDEPSLRRTLYSVKTQTFLVDQGFASRLNHRCVVLKMEGESVTITSSVQP
jgi:hypothetical protein